MRIEDSRPSLASLVAMLGCSATVATVSSDAGAPSSMPPAFASETQFAGEIARAYCESIYRCPSAGDQIAVVRTLNGSVERCTQIVRARLTEPMVLRNLSARGLARFDLRAAQRCVERVRTACGVMSGDLFARYCHDAYRGTVAVGGACSHSQECVPEAYCAITPASGCPGICRARTALGAACASEEECVRTSGSWPRCQATCVEVRAGAAAAAGMPCGLLEVNGFPSESVPCQDGLWCDARGGAGACRRFLPEGSPCTPDADVCVAPMVCLSDEGDRMGRCGRLTLATTEGATCSEQAAPRVFCDPVAGLFCERGRCVRGGDGRRGVRCRLGDVAAPCAEGLTCAGPLWTCESARAPGEACSSDLDCQSGFCGRDARCADVGCR